MMREEKGEEAANNLRGERRVSGRQFAMTRRRGSSKQVMTRRKIGSSK